MTPILKVISEYCSIYVDDVRLQELSVTDSPLYARRMWQYFSAAIPLFALPAEMPDFLIGNKEKQNLYEPSYDNTFYTVAETTESDLEIDLGSEYAGYELFSCRVREVDALGNVSLIPTTAEYDAETGKVTIPASAEKPIEQGTVFDFDFYTDGYFVNDLTPSIMTILGMCFQVVWQDRFNTDWLSMVTKIEDKSFYEQNRANKQNADTARLVMLREKLAGEMRRFEQNQYYKQTIADGNRLKI